MSTQQRITGAAVERAADAMGDRDWLVVAELQRLRMATGAQLQRLCFTDLTGTHADRSRRRVLSRLVGLGVLTTLDRRIGGVRAGSNGLVFVLDVLGLHLARLRGADAGTTGNGRLRHPGTPTERFLHHNLAVSELYVGLVELARTTAELSLLRFDAEPACWWQASTGDWIKPDAVLVLASAEVSDTWAVEVDQATESLPTVRRACERYLELFEQGEAGPAGPLPRVLFCVPDDRRLAAVSNLIGDLPVPAGELIHSTTQESAVSYLRDRLFE
jgi:Replication-relaxation